MGSTVGAHHYALCFAAQLLWTVTSSLLLTCFWWRKRFGFVDLTYIMMFRVIAHNLNQECITNQAAGLSVAAVQLVKCEFCFACHWMPQSQFGTAITSCWNPFLPYRLLDLRPFEQVFRGLAWTLIQWTFRCSLLIIRKLITFKTRCCD
jgi:hypothetical protein